MLKYAVLSFLGQTTTGLGDDKVFRVTELYVADLQTGFFKT